MQCGSLIKPIDTQGKKGRPTGQPVTWVLI